MAISVAMTNRNDSVTFERIEVFEERGARPTTWRVEAYDSDGGVDVNIFSGNDANSNLSLAAWTYDDARRTQMVKRFICD